MTYVKIRLTGGDFPHHKGTEVFAQIDNEGDAYLGETMRIATGNLYAMKGQYEIVGAQSGSGTQYTLTIGLNNLKDLKDVLASIPADLLDSTKVVNNDGLGE